MAAESRRESAGLIDDLFRDPNRFDFFQAVRLLEWLARSDGAAERVDAGQAVGEDASPDREAVRFRGLASLSFPPSALNQLQRQSPGAPPEMTVAFLGLIGANGVLPYHYTKLLLARLREKDHSLRRFLDVFNHRLVSLFFRAWRKYRLPFAYEHSRLNAKGEPDTATQGLYSLVGLGTGGLRDRLEIDDQAFLYYGGHFAHYPRSALALETLLSDCFNMPVTVEQLHGHWLVLERDDQTRLPNAEHRKGLNTQLGVDVVVGERVWDVQSMFRLHLGPLTYVQFRRFMPDRAGLRPLSQMTRAYAGPEFSFDIQLSLRAVEVPWCQLGGDEVSCLGWNTWVRVREFTTEVSDAVFSLADV